MSTDGYRDELEERKASLIDQLGEMEDHQNEPQSSGSLSKQSWDEETAMIAIERTKTEIAELEELISSLEESNVTQSASPGDQGSTVH